MLNIPSDIFQRFEQPEQAQVIVTRYYNQMEEGVTREAFEAKVLALLKTASEAPQEISIETLEIEMEAIVQSMTKRPQAQATGTVGNGSDDDLSNSFNDKESTFFDPPTWRG